MFYLHQRIRYEDNVHPVEDRGEHAVPCVCGAAPATLMHALRGCPLMAAYRLRWCATLKPNFDPLNLTANALLRVLFDPDAPNCNAAIMTANIQYISQMCLAYAAARRACAHT